MRRVRERTRLSNYFQCAITICSIGPKCDGNRMSNRVEKGNNRFGRINTTNESLSYIMMATRRKGHIKQLLICYRWFAGKCIHTRNYILSTLPSLRLDYNVFTIYNKYLSDLKKIKIEINFCSPPQNNHFYKV